MLILLVTHIIIAITSLVVAASGLLWPSQARLNLSYSLIAATIASGTALVIISHSAILHSCLTGLLYTVAALSLTELLRRRLVKNEQ